MDVPEAQKQNEMLHRILVMWMHHGLDSFRIFCEVRLLLKDHPHWLSSCSSIRPESYSLVNQSFLLVSLMNI